jgi:FtsP/CotA-like multicopper oxidase with cupredoxin domain
MKTRITRRSFLKQSALAASAASTLPFLTGCPALPVFCEPRVRRSIDGVLDTTLEARFALNCIGGTKVWTRTFEGTIPGPTLRVKPGDTMRIRLINNLPPVPHHDTPGMNLPHGFNHINLHTHGLHVSPTGISDNVFLELSEGNQIDLEFAIPADHPAGTYWYHPHKHGAVFTQVMSGMAGAIIIEGDIDEVPEIAAAKERLFVLNEIRIVRNAGDLPNGDGGGHGHGMKMGEENTQTILNQVPPFEFDAIDAAHLFRTVNGHINPIIHMRPGEVQRWRFVQAGTSQYLPLQLDGHSMQIIANDGIAIATPHEVESVLMPPGTRTDMLVKAGEPGTYYLRKLDFDQGIGLVPEEIIATLIVKGSPLDMPLPTALPTPSSLPFIDDDELTGQRNVEFNVFPPLPDAMFPRFVIDGQLFDPERVDHSVNLGAVEEWNVSNQSGEHHPFHIHTNPFLVMAIDGVPLATPVWRDTVDLPPFGSVRFRTRFVDFAGKMVLHCHILEHEDLGMMQVVEIV